MLKKTLLAALLPLAFCAHAQTAAPAAPSTAGKKEAVNRILKVQQPGIEALARNLVQQPAIDILDRAGAAIPERVAADKREAVGKEVQADAKKYLDETTPLVTDRAVKLAPTTVGALLEEKFTEAELKQIAGMLESQAYVKYQQLAPQMQKVLLEKLLADTRGSVEPKVKAMEASVARRLGVTVPPANGGGAAPATR